MSSSVFTHFELSIGIRAGTLAVVYILECDPRPSWFAMESDIVMSNMKHSKGVCENDSMRIFGDCSSNQFLEAFKSKKHARIFIHMLKSLVNRNHDIYNSLCESNSLIDKYKKRNRRLCDKLDCLKRKIHSSMNEVKKNESCFNGQECLSHACLFVHTALKVFNSCLWYLDSDCSRHMTGDKSLFKTLKEKEDGFVTFGDGSHS